jgi:hypothetical protein
MNSNHVEILEIEQEVKDVMDQSLRELNESQLAFVGGGSGDPILA